jgi:exodeoxyribonuclease-3
LRSPVALWQVSWMKLKIATWNINSVRLRIASVVRLLQENAPDILCLQETKCPQGQFPSAPLKELGYGHIAEFGQKGYHGVAIISRLPFHRSHSKSFCGKEDCRHIAIEVDTPHSLQLHNFYVPAGGDEPDPEVNDKFAHKLQFLKEMHAWSKAEAKEKDVLKAVVGDLNIAPLEHDVWSHKDLLKVVSHTPIETKGLNDIIAAGGWTDVMRKSAPEPEKLYTWWSYRARDWRESNRGRRLDHIWANANLSQRYLGMSILKECRDWQQPSDHVPVLAEFSF